MDTAEREVGIGAAPARAALAGNPSDGYGGAVLAITLPDRRARAVARPAPTLVVRPDAALVEATVRRFAREVDETALRTSVEWSTSIPRGVGLGGSSAIVIATLRALCDLHAVRLEPMALAACALAVETEDLGIAAGPQDRVAQSHGGVTFMEFAGDRSRCERLKPQLPPLAVAWRAEASEDSGRVHGDLRERFARGEPGVREAIAALAAAARRARAAVLAGDRDELARCVDASFDARRALMTLDPRHVEMIEIARANGAGSNFTGSGGAIIAVCRDGPHRGAVGEALAGADCGVVFVG
jgi:glucuronokinase